MFKKIKVGIIGYGVVGKKRQIAISQNKYFILTCISDITFKQNDINPKNNIKSFSNYIDLLSEDINAVFICLPTKEAVLATITSLKKNIHVFCEKPPARNLSELIKVKNIKSKKKNLKLMYGFNHRYHDSIIEAKKIIDSKKMGSIINFRGVYGKSAIIPFSGGWRSNKNLSGGGILIDQGIHMIDLILFFSNTFSKVHSFTSNSFWNHDVEDNAYILMKDKLGRVAMVHSSATEWRHKFRLEICMDKGLIDISGILSGSKSYGEEQLIIAKRINNTNSGSLNETTKKYLNDYSWEREINEFANIIIKNKKVLSGSIDDAINVMKLIEKIYKSDKD